jgi:enediyne biosynthesis protein E4
VHFGLGAAAKVDKLTVTWPGGGKQVLENQPVDCVITIEEK